MICEFDIILSVDCCCLFKPSSSVVVSVLVAKFKRFSDSEATVFFDSLLDDVT